MLPIEFFPDRELRCHCGCGLLPPRKSVIRLYTLRTLVGTPLLITSAARCKKHNKASGGKSGSIHLPANLRRGSSASWGGQAWDILAKPEMQGRIMAAALLCGFTGIGIGKGFIHVDDAARPSITYWKY